jgi:molecular chaperone HscB
MSQASPVPEAAAARALPALPRLSDDDFTLFGLPQRQRLDSHDLDVRRRELQGLVHPDRFAHEGAAAQRVAMQWAVRVNQAYQRLKNALSRAAYLCELRGAAVDAESNTAMPAAFLNQQMAWREALEDAVSVADIESLDGQVAREERGLLDKAAALLDDDGDAAAAAAQVRALMFVARFRQDIARRLDALDA